MALFGRFGGINFDCNAYPGLVHPIVDALLRKAIELWKQRNALDVRNLSALCTESIGDMRALSREAIVGSKRVARETHHPEQECSQPHQFHACAG